MIWLLLFRVDICTQALALCTHLMLSPVACRLSPYSTFREIEDSDPNHIYGYLTEQLNKYGLAYVHFVEARVAGSEDVEVIEEGQDLSIFSKKFQGTFIAAGRFLASEMLCW